MSNKLSEIGLALGRTLKSVYNEKEFVVSILSIVDTDEDRQKVLDYLETKPDADIDDITLFAVNIRRVRDGYSPYSLDDIE